jgi:hypothetical protein
MKICRNPASNITVKLVTMERVRKAVMTIIICQQNIKRQWVSMKICPNSALTLYVKIAINNIRITRGYGDIAKNVV